MKLQSAWKRGASCVIAATMALSMMATAMPAYAATSGATSSPTEDLEDDAPVRNHDVQMTPEKDVFVIGSHTFFTIEEDGTGKLNIAFADRDYGEDWDSIPSFYIKGSEYNEDDLDYGMYIVNGLEEGTYEVRYVLLEECHFDAYTGQYTFYHGTKDSATVSEDVDEADNEDPTMGTEFYINIENGIDPDGPSREEVVGGNKTDDDRVDYDITVQTKMAYQLKATIPMYVCMYGYRGTGTVVTPSKDAYQLKNYSTLNEDAKAVIVDITKVTHYTQLRDEDHSDETLYAIAFDDETGTYTYWYSKPSDDEAAKFESKHYTVVEDKKINASGQMYVIFIDDEFDFKTAGQLKDGAFRETVTKIDENHPLSEDFVYEEFEFGKDLEIGTATEGGEARGLAIKVIEVQARPSTWKLVSLTTPSSQMKRGEIAMSVAPDYADTDASALDLSKFSASMDITPNGWNIDAPETVGKDGAVTEDNATVLPLITSARIAGGNVNEPGCTSVVKLIYTVTPMFAFDKGEQETVDGNRTDATATPSPAPEATPEPGRD